MMQKKIWIVPAATVLLSCLFASFSIALAAKPLIGLSQVPPQVELINAEIAKAQSAAGIKSSATEDDARWCRRLFLDILGRIPSYDELDGFLKDKPVGRRSRLIEKLLYSDDYKDQYAANWSTIWANILIGRNGGMERNSLINRSGLERYLRECFSKNRPYSTLVYELITATGTTKPEVDGFNGATNFLAMKVNAENGIQATSAVSRIFLGLQVQCTQCHNHPFNQWKQQTFWDFNAFFRQTRALRRFVEGTNNIDFVELVDQDFPGEGGRAEDAEIYYQMRNGLTKVAYPVFMDGTSIGHSGYVRDVNRRLELGKLIVQSPFMDKMIVNRMWAHFLGHGFTKPLDDLGPHNSASHPDLLEKLSTELRANSFDLKQLISWIVMSDPYQSTSRSTKENVTDDPAMGEAPKFSHFYIRQMKAEELYESFMVSIPVEKRGTTDQQQQKRKDWLRQFTIAFGTDEGDETSTFNGTISQTLMMFNGELVREATSLDAGSWLERVNNSSNRTVDKVNYLFLSGLARKATQRELVAANQLLAERQGNPGAMLQDLWWAILNSNEFIMNH